MKEPPTWCLLIPWRGVRHACCYCNAKSTLDSWHHTSTMLEAILHSRAISGVVIDLTEPLTISTPGARSLFKLMPSSTLWRRAHIRCLTRPLCCILVYLYQGVLVFIVQARKSDLFFFFFFFFFLFSSIWWMLYCHVTDISNFTPFFNLFCLFILLSFMISPFIFQGEYGDSNPSRHPWRSDDTNDGHKTWFTAFHPWSDLLRGIGQYHFTLQAWTMGEGHFQFFFLLITSRVDVPDIMLCIIHAHNEGYSSSTLKIWRRVQTLVMPSNHWSLEY